jgi:peptidoglycan hydrolase-like protein with peptidoglycan-binding domain
MLKHFLVGGSVFALLSSGLLTGSLSAQAEAPKLEPQLPAQQTPLPPSAQNTVLGKYASTDAVPVLQRGSNGQAVEDVQQFLKRAGLYTQEVDGVFGPELEAAVLQFQELANLAPDGVIGYETWRAMLRSVPG